jgi:hypothetical protein
MLENIVTIGKNGHDLFYRTYWYSSYALDFYSGGARFETRPGHWISCIEFFVVFLTPFR